MRIEVVAHKGQPIEAFGADFDAAGGSIGREHGNTLVLPDMERHISRTHAKVLFRSGQFFLVDQGSATAVFVNEKPLGKDRESPLVEGDLVRIGAYVMRVGGTPRVVAVPSIAPVALAAPQKRATPAGADGVLGMFESLSRGDDPFGGLLTPSAPVAVPAIPASASPPPQKLVLREPAKPVVAPKPAGGQQPIPDDFDIFGTTVPSTGQGIAGAVSAIESAIDITSGNAFGSIDDLIESGQPTGGDPFTSSPPASGVHAKAPEQEGSVDPLELWGIAPPPGAVPAAPQSNHAPETQAAFRPPGVLPDPRLLPPATPSAAPARAVAEPARPATSQDALLAAFLEGAGLANQELRGPLSPEMMRLLGELLREATQGTLDLLGARAATKREFRADLTMIQGQNNNPLKFSPNVEEALGHLLSPRSGAYMTPGRAMRDAYNDLRSHQIGFMAGVEAALAGVLARFDPAELEQRLSQKSVFDSLLPMARKAKLWDLLVELYGDIAKDAEDDFHSLFTKEFLRAYHKQVLELEKQQRLKAKP